MNTKAFDSALDFTPAKPAPLANRMTTIGDWFSSIREGISLAGEYKELTNRGMRAEQAARQVFEKIGHN